MTGEFGRRTGNGNPEQSSKLKKLKINNKKNSKHSIKRLKGSDTQNLGDKYKIVKAGMAQGFTIRPSQTKTKPSSNILSGLDIARSINEPSSQAEKIEMSSRERGKMVIKVNSAHQDKTLTFSMKTLRKWMTNKDYQIGSFS